MHQEIVDAAVARVATMPKPNARPAKDEQRELCSYCKLWGHSWEDCRTRKRKSTWQPTRASETADAEASAADEPPTKVPKGGGKGKKGKSRSKGK